MDFYALISLALSVSCVLALARLPIFACADAPPDHATRRVSNLDGLRGFLAFAVVIYHAAIYRHYALTGRWEPVSAFSSMLGQCGVSLFFMLTGYLFWRRLVLSHGRIDWLRLYIGRVFRIGPVFLLASFIATAWSLHAGRHVPIVPLLLAKQIGHYLLIGMLPAVPVRGDDTNLLLAGVTWSLKFEWLFYGSLPLLAVLTRARRLHVAFAAALFLVPLATVWLGLPPGAINWYPHLCCLFGAGALTASLQVGAFSPRWSETTSSILAAVALGGIVFGFDNASTSAPIILLAVFFFLVVDGATLFGLLRTRAAHRLGHISYGLYLLQGLALAAVLRPLHAVSSASPLLHIALVVVSSVLLAFMALAAHRWVEQPGMRLGDRIARWACGWRDALLARLLMAGTRLLKQ